MCGDDWREAIDFDWLNGELPYGHLSAISAGNAVSVVWSDH